MRLGIAVTSAVPPPVGLGAKIVVEVGELAHNLTEYPPLVGKLPHMTDTAIEALGQLTAVALAALSVYQCWSQRMKLIPALSCAAAGGLAWWLWGWARPCSSARALGGGGCG